MGEAESCLGAEVGTQSTSGVAHRFTRLISPVSQEVERNERQAADVKSKAALRDGNRNEVAPEQIMSSFLARQASPEYQEMLVRPFVALCVLSQLIYYDNSSRETLYPSLLIVIRSFRLWKPHRYLC